MATKANRKQLVTVIKKLTLFSHYAFGEARTKNGDNFPFVTWPNGEPCLAANLYILSVMDRKGRANGKLSRRGPKAGTVGGYAYRISHLIRFCYEKNLDFTDLTDDLFCEFILDLRNKTNPNKPSVKEREETTVIDVGRSALDFLYFVGQLYGMDDFVAEEGSIRGYKRLSVKRYKNAVGIEVRKETETWAHRSFNTGSPVRTRNPIPKQDAKAVRKAVRKYRTRFVQARCSAILDLLEWTGARRIEVANLKVSDVVAAGEMQNPMLRMMTAKKGDEENCRNIPVTLALVNGLKKFIRLYRRTVVRKHLGDEGAHDFVFVASNNGLPINMETINKDLYELGKIAGVRVHPHLYRHAFITDIFVTLIERHVIKNNEDFRRRLLSVETFKAEVAQWTGHADPASLDAYIDLSFKRAANFSETVSSAHMLITLRYYDDKERELLEQLVEETITRTEYAAQLSELLTMRDKDLLIAKDRGEAAA